MHFRASVRASGFVNKRSVLALKFRHFSTTSAACRGRLSERNGKESSRYTAFAIETSCDDTSVAVIDVHTIASADDAVNIRNSSTHLVRDSDLEGRTGYAVDVVFHEKVTANNEAFTGIHPLVALESHRSNLAPVLKRAWDALKENKREEGLCPQVEFVAATRGPGMRSNLAVGLDTAKGMATALGVPLLGVHHMQAHALTPRLLKAQGNWKALRENMGYGDDEDAGYVRSFKTTRDDAPEGKFDLEPKFPFLTVLVSGGHTMLLNSTSLTEHQNVAESQDIALGDFLDKAARCILPQDLLKAPYGRALEHFAFQTNVHQVEDQTEVYEVDPSRGQHFTKEFTRPLHSPSYDYTPPARRQDELETRVSEWGWGLTPPLSESKGGEKSSRRMVYSFAGLLTSIERLVKRPEPLFTLRERQFLAREVQRVAFEHLASRILLYLDSSSTFAGDTIVVSGGVASNSYLRHVLRSILDARGHEHMKLCFPPIELCTDNALMIAWAGVEMYEAGYSSELSVGPIRKWSMDPSAADGGILGATGWISEGEKIEEEK